MSTPSDSVYITSLSQLFVPFVLFFVWSVFTLPVSAWKCVRPFQSAEKSWCWNIALYSSFSDFHNLWGIGQGYGQWWVHLESTERHWLVLRKAFRVHQKRQCEPLQVVTTTFTESVPRQNCAQPQLIICLWLVNKHSRSQLVVSVLWVSGLWASTFFFFLETSSVLLTSVRKWRSQKQRPTENVWRKLLILNGKFSAFVSAFMQALSEDNSRNQKVNAHVFWGAGRSIRRQHRQLKSSLSYLCAEIALAWLQFFPRKVHFCETALHLELSQNSQMIYSLVYMG